MKTIKKILIILTAVLLSGCSDFLEPDSPSTFDKVLVYSNLDDARKATNNIYVQFGQDGYRTRLSITMQGITDIMTGGDKSSTKDNYQIMALKAVSSNGDLAKAWTSAYTAIKDCNFVIEGLSNSALFNSTDPAISAEMHQLIGEAYTIRAFWYSQLVYNWGDVPYYRNAPVAGDNFDLPKTDRNQILSEMIDDLRAAETGMKWASQVPQSCQQVNREYAIGMIARLSLQRAGYYLKPDMTKDVATPADRAAYYTIARDYSQKLMTLKDRPLATDFAQIFKNQCNRIYPSESDMLFEVPFAIGAGEVGYNVGMNVASSDKHPYGKGGHDYSMPLSYFYSFDTKDKRLPATCGLYDLTNPAGTTLTLIPSAVSSTGIAQAKWSVAYVEGGNGSSVTKGTGINWPMMRYSDVLLMFAEAENELNGPTQAAKDALKRVRQRAFDSANWSTKVDDYITTISASKASFLKAIVDERAWEFGGELLRKNDLVRWGIYEDKMLETVNKIKAIGDQSIANDPNSIYANYIYWRVDNKKITIYDGLNSNTPPPGYNANVTVTTDISTGDTLPLDAWQRSDWSNKMKSSTTGLYNTFLDTQYSPYIDSTPIRYIQPIPSGTISNSAILVNDGYGFTN
ncbi:RagB/SusD family nutrient uptake outer membrane protein [Mariniflexile litorale]|uniref:RagB/SusD family nutrient uptake outer membrane protein n=1 Tax=Mariniflexile litorale TaxID=3045158 RepID=A0AAU7EGF3_9FLAO|nr:RagB/SusD family nutrient uptake outer membrane protein [Mariniflexile sp. KMM 9835]MDQ8211713.1 RagB/SusD family nutrient uptake outer membrane protein [Mariniflexile sp. KMM 9835]